MAVLKIKFNEDVRCFKAGSTASIELDASGITWLVGSNGCGKSTFMHILRSRKDSLHDINIKRHDSMEPSAISKLKSCDVDISGLDQYKNCYYLDAVIDNPVSLENSGTAGAYIGGGAMQYIRVSRGQGCNMMLSRFINDVAGAIDKDDDDSRNLIVLDEMDEGLDYGAQCNFGKVVVPKLGILYNADIICITHSILPIMASVVNVVHRFDTGETMPVDEYVSGLVGRKVVLEKENGQ